MITPMDAPALRTIGSTWKRLELWLRGTPRPMEKAHLSRTISLARIALIVGLVFLHYQTYPNSAASPFDGLDPVNHPLATFVNSFVLFFFFSAVPLLSMISGWLFFSTLLPEERLFPKIRHRFWTLYVPLVCWNLVYLAALSLVYLASPNHPLFKEINLQFQHATWVDLANSVLALTHHPIGYQFWFVRDLFVTVLVSPLLLVLLRRLPFVGLFVLGAAWLAGHDLWIFFRTDVVFFFYLGGLIGTRQINLRVAPHAAIALMLVYLVLVGLRAWAPAFIDMADHRPEWLTGATRAMRLVGVAACWGTFLWLAQSQLGTRMARYGGLAFFLFAMHFPLLAVIKWLLWRWVPAPTDAWMLTHYIGSVAVTITLGLAAGGLMSRHLPNCFALMNGGRRLETSSNNPSACPEAPGERDSSRALLQLSAPPCDATQVAARPEFAQRAEGTLEGTHVHKPR